MKKSKPTAKIKEGKKLDVGKLLKEKSDVESMIAFLENEYRKANITEKNYSEFKQKHLKKLKEINKKLEVMGFELKLAKKEGTKKSIEELAEEKPRKSNEIEEKKLEEVPERKKEEKPGFLKRLFRKKEKIKEEKQVEEGLVQQETEVIQSVQTQPKEISAPERLEGSSVEIEKLKVMIDTIREAKHVTDETIRTLSENIGEIRSMVFQADASLRENMLKMEKIEDDISEIKPQEIAKRFRETNETIEKQQITLEKLEKKSEDLAGKINKVYEMLKSIGSIENIASISKDIQKKLEDINEAVKYVERIGSKAEKIFVDLSRSLEEFVVYKMRQEDFDESLKEMIKSMDALNVKFEGYVSKKDLEAFKEDILIIKKQIEEINKILPIAQVKLPETILNLRKERENIVLFLDSLEEQFKEGKISREEYESVNSNNKKKLKEIEGKLKKEWGRLEKILKVSEKEKPEVAIHEEEAKEREKVEEKPEVVKEEISKSFEKKKVKGRAVSKVKREKIGKPKAERTKKLKRKLRKRVIKI